MITKYCSLHNRTDCQLDQMLIFFFFPDSLHKSLEKLTSENITEYFIETPFITPMGKFH